MTAEDRNQYGVDVAEIRPGDFLYYRDVQVQAADYVDLASGTLEVRYLSSDGATTAPEKFRVFAHDISA